MPYENSSSQVPETEEYQLKKFLTFRVDKEEYGIEIEHVTEIIGIQRITELPDTPEFVKGVINLRGRVIPVIDVRQRFGFEKREYDERTCIIVVNINNVAVGLIVDSVREVIDIPSQQIDSPPAISRGSQSRFIQGLGKTDEKVIIILDMNELLFENELNQIAVAASG